MITAATDPANGTVAIAGDGPSLTYEPDPNYCNERPAQRRLHLHAQRRLAGHRLGRGQLRRRRPGRRQRHRHRRRGLRRDPDQRARQRHRLDGGAKLIASASQPANGTVVVAGDGPSLTYEPDPDYCNERRPQRQLHLHAQRRLARHRLGDRQLRRRRPGGGRRLRHRGRGLRRDHDRRARQRHRHRRRPEADPAATQPANGTVAVTGGGPSLTYEPDPDYCNDGGPDDNFTYTLNGGSQATVSVAVTCVDDNPVAVDDSATVAEDSAATAIDVLANDTDVDGGPKLIPPPPSPPTAPSWSPATALAHLQARPRTTATTAARTTTSPTP